MYDSIKYSIIVPVYNVQEFLEECLISIKDAMTQDCECIVINDGATDNSGSIAQLFCAKNNAFSYYEKENGGLSDARNFGLAFAKGYYTIFVDSDDVISPLLIKTVDHVFMKSKADVVYYNFIKFYQGSSLSLFSNQGEAIRVKYSDKKELAKKPNFAWARVAETRLYRENKFPVGVIYEDVVTSPYISQHANLVAFVANPLYGYRKRSGSITTVSAEKQFKLFEAVDILRAKQKNGEVEFVFYSTALINLSQSCLVSLVRISNKNTRSKYRRLIRGEYGAVSCMDIMASYASAKYKILSLASKNSFTLYVLEKILRCIVLFSDKRNR